MVCRFKSDQATEAAPSAPSSPVATKTRNVLVAVDMTQGKQGEAGDFWRASSSASSVDFFSYPSTLQPLPPVPSADSDNAVDWSVGNLIKEGESRSRSGGLGEGAPHLPENVSPLAEPLHHAALLHLSTYICYCDCARALLREFCCGAVCGSSYL